MRDTTKCEVVVFVTFMAYLSLALLRSNLRV